MKLIRAAAVLAVVIVSPVYAACVEPDSPTNIPDGNTATLQDMLSTQKTIAAYNTATNSYLDCLKKEHDDAVQAGGTTLSSKDRDKLDKDETTRNNAAVDKLNKVAGQFNEQVRVFKAKNAAPPPKNAKSPDNKG